MKPILAKGLCLLIAAELLTTGLPDPAFPETPSLSLRPAGTRPVQIIDPDGVPLEFFKPTGAKHGVSTPEKGNLTLFWLFADQKGLMLFYTLGLAPVETGEELKVPELGIERIETDSRETEMDSEDISKEDQITEEEKTEEEDTELPLDLNVSLTADPASPVYSESLVTLKAAVTGAFDGALLFGWKQLSGPEVHAAEVYPDAATYLRSFQVPAGPAQLSFQVQVAYQPSDPAQISKNWISPIDLEVLAPSVPEIEQGETIEWEIEADSIMDDPENRIDLSAIDEDAPPDGLLWSIAEPLPAGSARFAGAGDSLVTSSSGEPVILTYEPVPGFSGNDTMAVKVDDGKGGTDTIAINITVLSPANTIYVDASYDGAEELGTEDQPFTTLGAGLAAVTTGGTVFVKAGDYTWTQETSTINKKVAVRGPEFIKPSITLQAYWLTLTSSASGSEFYNLKLISSGNFFRTADAQTANNITLENTEFINTAQPSIQFINTVYSLNAPGVNANWTVAGCVFRGTQNQAQWMLANHANLRVIGNQFHQVTWPGSNAPAVWLLSMNGDALFSGNLFADAGGMAIGLSPSGFYTGHLSIVHNTFYGSSGIAPDAAAYYQDNAADTVMNNLFANNARSTLSSPPNAAADLSRVEYNLFYANNGTQDGSRDDIFDPNHSRYIGGDPYAFSKGPDISPSFLSTTHGEPNFLRFTTSSPAASGAFEGAIRGGNITSQGKAYFGAFPALGDIDGDSLVNNGDANILQDCLNGSLMLPDTGNGLCTSESARLADLDGDGDVDGNDFLILSNNWTG